LTAAMQEMRQWTSNVNNPSRRRLLIETRCTN
jgi:hypothetical protein